MVAALNAPHIWWHATPTPLLLRVFGRSLAWDTHGTCLNATTPLAAPATRLVLLPGGASVGAIAATCFEATFPLHTLPPVILRILLSFRWNMWRNVQFALLLGNLAPFARAGRLPERRCAH